MTCHIETNTRGGLVMLAADVTGVVWTYKSKAYRLGYTQ